jgi:transcriptional regulator with XRE-family HTH domain
MGSGRRRRPQRLAEKLLRVREALGLSQGEMAARLGPPGELERNSVSNFERGFREPDLLHLLAYARAANLHLEVLVDDSLDLPQSLPSPGTHAGVRRRGADRGGADR